MIYKIITVFLCLAFLPGIASADKYEILDQMYALEVETYRCSTQFHMFTFLEGDAKAAAKLESSLAKMQSLLPSRSQLGGDKALESIVANIRASLKDYKKAAQANEMRTQGYTSIYAVNDLDAAENKLLGSLAAGYDYLTGNQPGLRQQVMSAAARVQKMASRYARLAAHWNGRTGLMADEEGDTIDIHAKAFAKQFANLKAHIDDERLSKAETKWMYISGKLVNYQDQTVPFLVTRYSDTIVSSLMDVGLDTSIESPALAAN
ncbi:hypothetical protein MIB92_11185 [Aestuariirhabdus sp. Z084]|uniref:hypothetical protein n=1 Tax=Aestuariirhabdus haliotis TaxID=2918751 RepID=UPI00201B38BE|nr:hypothetical protein [Aestuariirhabdus haliotis]MCL6416216.1 hypothetical protein [Aestuariirhabdus haliotis]MCL6420324.1 hypothetical protein [Aestuariirhabdus haliotis]